MIFLIQYHLKINLQIQLDTNDFSFELNQDELIQIKRFKDLE